jgi:hypothetical protein
MAQKYDTAIDRMVLFDEEPLNLRRFELLLIDTNLLATKRVDFDREQDSVSEILGGDDFLNNVTRVALRTQLIPKPLDPASATSTAPKLLQFFAVDANNNTLTERRMAGLIVERDIDTGDDTPLFLLNSDEVWGIAHGDGFATEIAVDQPVAAGAARSRKSSK